MVTWLPRESATTPRRRSISARFWPYWPKSIEASRLSSKASTTWVAALSSGAAGEGRRGLLSDPRVRKSSSLQDGFKNSRDRWRRVVRRRLRELAEQAVGPGA